MTEQQNDEQDRVMKSLAAGTATLDAFLARAYRGFTLQNYFTFGSFGNWSSHARWFEGGQGWPAWKLLTLFNLQGTGNMLRTDTLQAPNWEAASIRDPKSRVPLPLVGIYALRRGDRFMIFVISRKIAGYPLASTSGYSPVAIELPFRHYKTATVFRTVGGATDNNLHEDRVGIESHSLADGLVKDALLKVDAASGADARGLPPASTLLYVFEGTDAAP
jgi:hypothetical protein